ncbi:MAG: phosphatase PAP2 family protein [Prevotellaceae bacterium]|nr:phosphatase PAP2 family protein [Prevotellaceae bacterium]
MTVRTFIFSLLIALSTVAGAQNWDIHTLRLINGWDSGFPRSYSNIVSSTTPFVAVGVPVAMAAVAVWKGNRTLLYDAVYVGSSVIEAAALTYGMKYVFDRRRPYDKYPDIRPSGLENSPSFPSTHAATAFALAASLSLRYPKWYVIVPSALWAGSVGFSRLNKGVHYTTDVLAGAAVGIGCAVLNTYVNRYLQRWLDGKLFR